ncbi:hypothetical protein [Rhizobium ruizarguesonis]|jgi:hypothetical protein|uniref:Secreted protein n=1 Tax=Rhizobium ruizarguesonis TaxID=2081791 RepID=A0AB38I0C6_9HYPH|nr:hypothetical protein [Rhizobium ruizarguesonis]NEI05006.1 hypothetical protein [Rhizobium ruizarguesonis]NEI28582.1 hypothetical protein [Rhizobium ruizarguesonis]TAY94659.1 hypothetical protein ELH85_16470 [Rhizobium ruizarguesonis]TAZ79063.1 hypothetical protein ELH68_15390 [Rhizobium ruizarguesonis]TBA05439.1 hypothetical protein ELH64_13880 [Rhizobium ruizarguesonis]
MTYLKHDQLIAAAMLATTMTSLRQAEAAECEQETFEEAGYVVCIVEADKATPWRNVGHMSFWMSRIGLSAYSLLTCPTNFQHYWRI